MHREKKGRNRPPPAKGPQADEEDKGGQQDGTFSLAEGSSLGLEENPSSNLGFYPQRKKGDGLQNVYRPYQR